MLDPQKLIHLDNKSYQIYALIDPRNNNVRYIGMSKNAEFRYHQHITSPSSVNTLHWTEELEQLGLSPILQVLEIITHQKGTTYEAFRLTVYEREAYWIQEYLHLGMPLLNTLGVTRKYPQWSTLYLQHAADGILRTTQLSELIEKALMTNKEVAEEAKLSPGTVSRMVNGRPVSRLSVRKVLAVLSKKLDQKIEIEEIKGLKLTEKSDESED